MKATATWAGPQVTGYPVLTSDLWPPHVKDLAGYFQCVKQRAEERLVFRAVDVKIVTYWRPYLQFKVCHL